MRTSIMESQVGGLLITLLCTDVRFFLTGGMGGVPPPAKNLHIPPPNWKKTPVDSPHQFFISSPPKLIPPNK